MNVPTKLRKSGFEPIRDYLDAEGIPWSIDIGGKHFKLRFTVGETPLSMPVSGNSNCPRGRKNMLSDLRRLVTFTREGRR